MVSFFVSKKNLKFREEMRLRVLALLSAWRRVDVRPYSRPVVRDFTHYRIKLVSQVLMATLERDPCNTCSND